MNESTVEQAALNWFADLEFSTHSALALAPDAVTVERNSFSDVLLNGRLRSAITQLNPAISSEAREEALRKVLRHDAPSLIGNNRAFHQMLRDGVPVEYRRADDS